MAHHIEAEAPESTGNGEWGGTVLGVGLAWHGDDTSSVVG